MKKIGLWIGVAGAAVLAWLGYEHLNGGAQGSIPGSASPSILPAWGRLRQPAPLGWHSHQGRR